MVIRVLTTWLAKRERGLLTALYWPCFSVTLVFSYRNIQISATRSKEKNRMPALAMSGVGIVVLSSDYGLFRSGNLQ